MEKMVKKIVKFEILCTKTNTCRRADHFNTQSFGGKINFHIDFLNFHKLNIVAILELLNLGEEPLNVTPKAEVKSADIFTDPLGVKIDAEHVGSIIFLIGCT
jgi:hypothetical protein